MTTAGPTGSRSDNYGYDGSGNTTARPGAGGTNQALVWDAEGNLSSLTEGANVTTFLYDADGNRLIRRDPAGTTVYLGDTELRVAGGIRRATRYYHHGGDVVAVRGGGKVAWLVPDAHGTDELAIDAATLAVTRQYTLPYGAARGPAVSNWPGERGFVGGTVDGSTGLTRLGARDYDPGTARFLSADPVVDHTDRQQVNGYAYANNNPTTFTDQDGRKVKIPKPTGVVFGEIRSILEMAQRDVTDWPDVYPYHEVYPTNYGRDIRDSPVGSCHGGDPAPAIACGMRSTGQVERVTYVSMPRECVGWNECITPRPYESVPVFVDDDQSAPEVWSPRSGGGRSAVAAAGFGRPGPELDRRWRRLSGLTVPAGYGRLWGGDRWYDWAGRSRRWCLSRDCS